MPRLHDSLTTEFHRIHLDPQEFATICAITTWKIHQWGTVEANTVAGQHYLAVIKELNNHHKVGKFHWLSRFFLIWHIWQLNISKKKLFKKKFFFET